MNEWRSGVVYNDLTRSDGLSDLLRALSQRRRQGLLEISAYGAAYRLLFSDGKIVSVGKVGDEPVKEICDRFLGAGLLSEEFLRPVFGKVSSVEGLYDLLVAKGNLSHDDFIRAKIAYELDLLHSVRDLNGARMEFTAKLVKVDSEISLSVYPGQLLLDMAEFDLNKDSFADIFEGSISDRIVSRRGEPSGSGLTEAEVVILSCLDEKKTVKDVFEQALLCEYEVREALLGLHTQDVISVGSAEYSDTAGDVAEAEDNFSEDIVSLFLEGSKSSDSFADEFSKETDTPDVSVEEYEVGDGSWSPEDEIVPSFDISPLKSSILYDETGQEEEGVVNCLEKQDESYAGDQSDVQGTASKTDEDGLSSEEPDSDGVGSAVQNVSLNDRLCEERIVNKIVIFATLFYLVALALILPGALDKWFRALSDFTLNAGQIVIF